MTPTKTLKQIWGKIKREWRLAFMSAFCIGLLVHMPALLSDIPNHDGLESLYFDQNMITSGRWFLMLACGPSSFYCIPWVIGILGLVYLGLAAMALTELLELKKDWAIVASSGLLVVFPALASTFAYVFTLDGYMLALLLAVSAVLLAKKYKYGFLPGGISLAFSMGVYQAYLPFAMILSVFSVLFMLQEAGGWKEKCRKSASYLLMGGMGAGLYYVLLRILLLIQGKELASYQGISDMTSSLDASAGLVDRLLGMYRDFAAFSIKGNVLWNNLISALAWGALVLCGIVVMLIMTARRKWWKNPGFFAIIIVTFGLLPLITNVILFISPSVTYHLLMRYQWVLFPIGLIAIVSRYGGEDRIGRGLEWVTLAASFLLVFFYAVTDNIAYSNLEKKYEKTYAYCVRLLDRIEQTEGYYQGIPIAMIGVVGDEQFPPTDITLAVTSGMIGLNGDMLLYTGENYRLFIQNYLGATLNILSTDIMSRMYYDEEYIAMDSFPGKNSIRIIDGVMYIKTENTSREEGDS